jgi:hypothetical protein
MSVVDKYVQSVPKIAIHLGAHKTATTYLQIAFEAIRNSGSGDYLGLLTPKGCRSMAGLSFHTFGRSSEEIDDIVSRSRQCLHDWLCSELRRGASRLLISEEQILGSSRLNITSELLYPGLVDRLLCIPETWQCCDLSLFLAVRNYADFFASSYATTVKRGLRLEFSVESRFRLSRLPRRWTHVVSDVLSCFPSATLHLWRYEDFASVRDRLMWLATGWSDCIVWQELRPMKSLSHEEMELVLSSRRGNLTLRKMRGKAARRYPEPHHRYDPWDPQLRMELDELYREDCNQLSRVSNIQLHGSW